MHSSQALFLIHGSDFNGASKMKLKKTSAQLSTKCRRMQKLQMLQWKWNHQQRHLTTPCQQSHSNQPPNKMKLLSFVDAHSQHSQPEHADLALTMRRELMDYFKTAQLEYDNDPLAWWKSHASDFPHVARTAKTALSIPASPALVERIFSTAGKIFRPERTRLQRRSLSSWFLSSATSVYSELTILYILTHV